MSSRKAKEDYYNRVISKYSKIVRATFLSNLRLKKPFVKISNNNLSYHVKNIMLYHILTKIKDPDPLVWPPPVIHQIIDRAVNTYIDNISASL